jgi:hypothetical protein
MKHLPIIAIAITLPQTTLALECMEKQKTYQVLKCEDQKLCIINNGKKSIVDQKISDEDNIACIDVNFDGYQDIIVTHPPSGQIQLSSVFIYDNRNEQFKKNEELSKLPCLKIDKSKKLISGTCFSSSNCDKWIEQYRFKPNGRLQITKTKGTYCDPTTGNAFSYTEIYENRKIFKKQVKN